MFKSIIKETCIMLLLCVAVVLVFGIAFYDYIPLTKVIPDKVTYVVPEDIKAELETNVQVDEMQEQIINYSVSAQDLKQYEDSGVYEKGNPNPFKAFSYSGNSTIVEGNGSSSTSNNSNSNYYYPTNTSTK